jgi:hypothetical protein
MARRPKHDRASDLAATRRLTWFEWWVETPNDDLDTYAVAVIAMLFKHMGRDGWCKVGSRRIARPMRCSRETVEARLRLLADLGVVYAMKRYGATTWHAAAFPEDHPLYLDRPRTLAGCPWHRPSRRRATGQAQGRNRPISALQPANAVGTNPGTRVTGAPSSVAGAPSGAPPSTALLVLVKDEVHAIAAQVVMGPPPTDAERSEAQRQLTDAAATYGIDAVVDGCGKARGYEYRTLDDALANTLSFARCWHPEEDEDDLDD